MILESDRKVHETNMKSLFVILDKRWAQYNELKKGDTVKVLSGSSISVIIAPNSPLATEQGLKKFKEELLRW